MKSVEPAFDSAEGLHEVQILSVFYGYSNIGMASEIPAYSRKQTEHRLYALDPGESNRHNLDPIHGFQIHK